MTASDYRAARVLVGDKWQCDQRVSVDDNGTITAIRPYQPGAPCTDLGDVSLLPGLIDSHIHGAKGCDVMDASHQSLNTISAWLATRGVTAFVATTVTAPVQKIEAALRQVARSRKTGTQGAELLGSYLEGPYFTETHKGAHPPAWFREADNQEFESWLSRADGSLLCVALAAEKPGALSAIRYLRQQGARVMIGHSDASFDQTQAALDAGANGIVHCFNGMRGLHHRDPGVAGAGLCHPNSFVELIADGHHVHPTAVDVACRCAGERLVLISDAMCAAGMPDGSYQLGEYSVEMSGGVVRTSEGGLAGSTLNLFDAVMNIRRWLSIPLEQAWLYGSRSPARALGLGDRLGTLEAGKQASMVALNQHNQIQYTWVNGRPVFDATISQEAVCI